MNTDKYLIKTVTQVISKLYRNVGNGIIINKDSKNPALVSYNDSCLFACLQIEPNTAFLRAARAGQLDTVVELLDSGAVKDINTCNSVGITIKLISCSHPIAILIG